MILYLSRNESANLLDVAASDNALHIRKMSGSFSLLEFINMDMRKYASCRIFCIERLAITEKDAEFLEALQSFKMMYSARVVIILENADGLTKELVKIGVTNIVTAADEDEKLEQIAECLSGEGMQRYKSKPKPKPVRTAVVYDEPDEYADEYEGEPVPDEKETLAQSLNIKALKKLENEHYRFDCLNVKIGVLGATRRVGTTTAALGLANFIKKHGGTVCYVALNMNQHLSSIAAAYDFDVEDDYFTYDGIDFYEGMLPKYDYNFIISDFGEAKREAVRKYKESDVHLLCGASGRRYEVTEFTEAFKQVRSVKPRILTYAPNPDYGELFSSVVPIEPTVVRPVKDMLDYTTNGIVFKGIIKEYIVETSKRL